MGGDLFHPSLLHNPVRLKHPQDTSVGSTDLSLRSTEVPGHLLETGRSGRVEVGLRHRPVDSNRFWVSYLVTCYTS